MGKMNLRSFVQGSKQRRNIFMAALFLVAFLIMGFPAVWASASLGGVSASGDNQKPDGYFNIWTSDGIELKLRRYRPSMDVAFREGAQPILLFSGIIANMNVFLIHTPKERKDAYGEGVIENPAAWAVGDPYIEQDRMMYHNLGYYLWKLGFDPWFLNYRGTGLGVFKSDVGSGRTSLDVWAMIDVPAAIEEVTQQTGIPPVIGGHSTGGFVSYAYLQGATFENGPGSHVRSDPDLARERNQAIPGVIVIDPAGEPPLPAFLDLPPLWWIMNIPLYIDIQGWIIKPFAGTFPGYLMTTGLPLMLEVFYNLDEMLGGDSLFRYLAFWNAGDTSLELEDFIIRYVFDSAYIHGFAQYYDFGIHHTVREFWKNGPESQERLVAPKPDPGNDGYYYYKENMSNVKVPFITFLSEADGMVSSEVMLRDLVKAKAPHALDESFVIKDTAHIDVAMGLITPTEIFPRIGAWLEKCFPEGPGGSGLQEK